MTPWYQAVLERTETISPSVKRFFFQLKGTESFDFKPGQFVTMDLPIHEKRLMRWKSYSIASVPDGTNNIELCIAKVENGLASTYLFDVLKPGDEVKLKGPDGIFVLPEDAANREMIFICTGTGVAPFRSMIHQLYQHPGVNPSRVSLIFGTRQSSGLLYRDEFEKLAQEHPAFQYIPVLSRDPEWTGAQGYVHQVYTDRFSGYASDSLFYLCGWRNMIDEAKARLLELGVPHHQIIEEIYG